MKRLRISLRKLLLFVALCAVLFAWMGARRKLNDANLRGRLRSLQIQRDYAAGRLSDPVEGVFWQQSLKENEAMIEVLREPLGQLSRPLGAPVSIGRDAL